MCVERDRQFFFFKWRLVCREERGRQFKKEKEKRNRDLNIYIYIERERDFIYFF